MRTFSTCLLAVCAAAALSAHAPVGGGDQAADPKLQAFRTLCAGEARKVSAASGTDYLTPGETGVAPMDEFFTQFSTDPESRRAAKAEFHDAMEAGASAFHRANMGLAACAIYFSEASEIGIPLRVMERQWSEERVDVYALNGEPPARVPAPVPSPTPAPAAPTAQPVADSGGCITIDWGAGGQGDPAVLRNVCGHALNVGVCIKVAAPGSASEAVSCEQSRFSSYHLPGRSAVTVPATHGTVHSRVCTPPQIAAMWWENGRSVGNCR
jgi:hypothetical protein